MGQGLSVQPRRVGVLTGHAQDPGAAVPGDHHCYAGALLLIPDSIVGLFHDRFMAYNLDQAKGVQSMVVRQFRQAPREQWPAVAQELAGDFAPLQLRLLPMDQAGLSDQEQARLAQGLHAVRIGEWGYYETVLAPWTNSGW